jgi:hypothetical protein
LAKPDQAWSCSSIKKAEGGAAAQYFSVLNRNITTVKVKACCSVLLHLVTGQFFKMNQGKMRMSSSIHRQMRAPTLWRQVLQAICTVAAATSLVAHAGETTNKIGKTTSVNNSSSNFINKQISILNASGGGGPFNIRKFSISNKDKCTLIFDEISGTPKHSLSVTNLNP